MDDYKIKTPEQVDIAYTVAGLGTRFLALAIDTLIQSAVLIVLIVSLQMISDWDLAYDFAPDFSEWYIAVMIIVVSLLIYGYPLLFELILKGRTPGKAALKLRVVRVDGRAADVAGIILRNLIRLIDFLPAFYTVGVISMFINKDSRRLGDLVAGTVVIVDKRKATLTTIMAEQSQKQNISLSDREYAMVRDFLARKKRLTPEARGRLAAEIAGPLFERLETPEYQRNDPEGFLENLL